MSLDAAYANATYIPGGTEFPMRWAADALAFRAAKRPEELVTGPHPRERVDLFRPAGPVRGLTVFVHGGYWMESARSDWSHLAAGPLQRGWAVALPGYPLCPEVDLPTLRASVTRSIEAAAGAVPGVPIILSGHSAGGHLVARILSAPDPFAARDRVTRVVAISPLGDLAPLLRTAMREELSLTPQVAEAESPITDPAPDVPVTIWVGEDERPAFLDQARRLGRAWNAPVEVEAHRHHFDVIDGLADPAHPLCRLVSG